MQDIMSGVEIEQCSPFRLQLIDISLTFLQYLHHVQFQVYQGKFSSTPLQLIITALLVAADLV